MQGYFGGAQPGYPQYPGQVPQGYQAGTQYPASSGYGAQPGQTGVTYGQPGMPAAAYGAPFNQSSYAAGVQLQRYPPARPEDANVQLPPTGIDVYLSVHVCIDMIRAVFMYSK